MNKSPFVSDKQRLLNMGTWKTVLVQTDLFSHAAIHATDEAIPFNKGGCSFCHAGQENNIDHINCRFLRRVAVLSS